MTLAVPYLDPQRAAPRATPDGPHTAAMPVAHYTSSRRQSRQLSVNKTPDGRDVRYRTEAVTRSCNHPISERNNSQALLTANTPAAAEPRPRPTRRAHQRLHHPGPRTGPPLRVTSEGRPAREVGDGEASTPTPGRTLTETVVDRYASLPAVPSPAMCPRNTPASPSRGAGKSCMGRDCGLRRWTCFVTVRIVSGAGSINADGDSQDAVTHATHSHVDGMIQRPDGSYQISTWRPLWRSPPPFGQTRQTPASSRLARFMPERRTRPIASSHAPALFRVLHPCPGTMALGEDYRVTLPCPARDRHDERSGW